MEMKPLGGPNSMSLSAFGLRDLLSARLSQQTQSPTAFTESPAVTPEPLTTQRMPPPAPLADVVVNGSNAAHNWIKQELDYATHGSPAFNQLKQQINQYRLDGAADHMQKYIDDIESRGSPYDPDVHFEQGVDSNGWLVDGEAARLKEVGYLDYTDAALRSGAYSAPE